MRDDGALESYGACADVCVLDLRTRELVSELRVAMKKEIKNGEREGDCTPDRWQSSVMEWMKKLSPAAAISLSCKRTACLPC